MRFLIETIELDRGWEVTIKQGEWTSETRLLREVKDRESGQRFPLPPGEIPDEPHSPFCNATDVGVIDNVLQKIHNRNPDSNDDVINFGRYLFTTLIDQNLWDQIKKRAGDEPIELALCWPSNEAHLQRLPWEVMHTGKDFLIVSDVNETSVIRIVLDGDAKLTPLDREPRMLFAIGCALNDPRISPGAEYLGLMRALDAKVIGGTRVIQSRILEKASPDQLQNMVRDFRPDVVHFICHGKDGKLKLQYEKEDRREDEHQDCDAERITKCLEGPEGLPQVVFLNACDTGNVAGPLSPDEVNVLAARLVHHGIPIVVGMGGEVADSVCRLFARAFGVAMLSGKAMVPAAAAARRKAFDQAGNRVDWIFPQIYLSRKVKPKATLTFNGLQEREEQIQNAILNYRLPLKEEPRFSARFAELERFRGFLKRDDETKGILVLEGGTDYGKSRLLQEMAIIAIREGHFPVALINQSTANRPSNIWDVVSNLLSTLRIASSASGKENPFLQMLYLKQLKDSDTRPPELSVSVQYALDCGDVQHKVNTAAIIQALREDISALMKGALAAGKWPIDENAAPVLLIDDLNLCPQHFVQDFLCGDTTGCFGIGKDDFPIPVVVTFDKSAPSMNIEILKSKRAWVTIDYLEDFHEDIKPYDRMLLHPFRKNLNEYARTRKPDAGEEDLKKWRNFFYPGSELKWIPGDFVKPLLYVAVENEVLHTKADDEEILREILA